MALALGKLVFRKILANPETKKKVFAALRAEATKTNTQVDDELVTILETCWDVAIPAFITAL